MSKLNDLWARVGPRASDLLFIGFALVLASSQILSTDLAPELVLDQIPSSILAVPAICALWWRRSHPEAVLVGGLGLVAVTGIYIVAVIALFSLAIRRRDRVLVLFAGASAVVLTLGTSWRVGVSIQTVVPVVVIVLLAVLAGAYLGIRRDLLASLRAQVAQADAERELRVTQARTAERSRIAREMHDVLAHKVSLIALQAGGLEVAPAAGASKVEHTAQQIGPTARQALNDLREVLGVLREDASADGADLAPQPTEADLPALVESSRAAGVDIDLWIDGAELPPTVGRAAYRIVQEALTNVHKHAARAATRIRVTGAAQDTVIVEIENARPVAPRLDLPGSGAGLVGLRERTALLGGSLTYGETPDGGWLVRASLPWPAQASATTAGTAS